MATRSSQTYTRRSRWPQVFVGGLFGLLIISGGVIGTLALLGVNLNPFATKQEDPFMVRIPINAKPIPAYARIDRLHLINPTTGGSMFQKVPPKSTIGMSIIGIDTKGSHAEGAVEDVKRVDNEVVFVVSGGHEVRQAKAIDLGGAKMNINDIIGRVVKKDKRAGLGFRDETFFPPGTPEGIAGATPPGMRTITLDATKLTGVHSLNAGDRIDLMASVAESQATTDSKAPSGDVNRLIGATQSNKRGEDQATQPFLLAQDAVVLKPVYVRNEAEASASLTQGKRIQNVPKYEVAIAVKTDDVIPLQSALHKQLAITCIARSMQPGADTQVVATVQSDMVRVPVTVRAILAYDVVSRDAFVSPATRVIRMEDVSRQQVDRLGIVTSLDEALGSVARHDIPSGSFVRQSDLLSSALEPAMPPVPKSKGEVSETPNPFRTSDGARLIAMQGPQDPPASTATAVGDRPSITRFVPAGRTAFAIPWNRIYGGEHLQIGDSIDLLASYSLEIEQQIKETETRPDGTVIVRDLTSLLPKKTDRTSGESFAFRGEPWFVATEAIVIGPVGFPAPASAMRALGEQATRGTANTNQSGPTSTGPAIIVSVDERDLEAVSAVLATKDATFTIGFHSESDSNRPVPVGMKRIALVSERLPAFELLAEHGWKGSRRRLISRMVQIDNPQFASAIEMQDVANFYGMTLRRTKERFDFLTREDFMEANSGHGIAAASREGYSLFPIADSSVLNIDSFVDNDRIAILERGIVNGPQGVIAHGFSLTRPVSHLLVPEARIIRSTIAGRTVLEVPNEFVTILQAALAGALEGGRTFVAVAPSAELELVEVLESISVEMIEGEQVTKECTDAIPVHGPGPVEHHDPVETATEIECRVTQQVKSNIPSWDPLAGVKFLELVIGKHHENHAFLGNGQPRRHSIPVVKP